MNDIVKAYSFTDRFKVIFFAFLGTIFIYVGAFAPAVEVTLFGSYTYFEFDEIEMWLLLVMSVVALVTALKAFYKLHKIVCLIVLACPFWPLIKPYFEEEKGVLEKMGLAISGSINNMLMIFVEFSWGGMAMAMGLLCTLLSFIYSFNRKKVKKAI